jgi:hypothetical protein
VDLKIQPEFFSIYQTLFANWLARQAKVRSTLDVANDGLALDWGLLTA